MEWFWYFLGYGFLGYVLEKVFARAVRSERQVRKGFLFAPVCPVYGLAMCTFLALGAARIVRFHELALLGAGTASAVEYAVHWCYERLFGVRFWDYSATKMDVNGRICLPFSLAWGILSALAVRCVQPTLAALAARIPVSVSMLVLFLFGLDTLWSAGILLRWGDVELLTPCALRRKGRTA